jgi:hypothetical protein
MNSITAVASGEHFIAASEGEPDSRPCVTFHFMDITKTGEIIGPGWNYYDGDAIFLLRLFAQFKPGEPIIIRGGECFRIGENGQESRVIIPAEPAEGDGFFHEPIIAGKPDFSPKIHQHLQSA